MWRHHARGVTSSGQPRQNCQLPTANCLPRPLRLLASRRLAGDDAPCAGSAFLRGNEAFALAGDEGFFIFAAGDMTGQGLDASVTQLGDGLIAAKLAAGGGASAFAPAKVLGRHAPVRAGEHLCPVGRAGLGMVLFASLAELGHRLIAVGLGPSHFAAARPATRHALEFPATAGKHEVSRRAHGHPLVARCARIAGLVAGKIAARALLHGRAPGLAAAWNFDELTVVAHESSPGVEAACLMRIARASWTRLARAKGKHEKADEG